MGANPTQSRRNQRRWKRALRALRKLGVRSSRQQLPTVSIEPRNHTGHPRSSCSTAGGTASKPPLIGLGEIASGRGHWTRSKVKRVPWEHRRASRLLLQARRRGPPDQSPGSETPILGSLGKHRTHTSRQRISVLEERPNRPRMTKAVSGAHSTVDVGEPVPRDPTEGRMPPILKE